MAGLVIVAGAAAGLITILFVAILGDVRAAEAQFRDITAAVGHVGSLRVISFAWAGSILVVLLGFVLLAVNLWEQGSRRLPVLAVVAFAIFAIAWVIEAAFHAGVTAWAVGQVEQGEVVPELFHQLKRWLNVFLQVIVNPLGLLALIAFASASLQTGVLPSWAAWSLIIYCGLVVFFPLPLLIAPAVAFYGVTLLIHG